MIDEENVTKITWYIVQGHSRGSKVVLKNLPSALMIFLLVIICVIPFASNVYWYYKTFKARADPNILLKKNSQIESGSTAIVPTSC